MENLIGLLIINPFLGAFCSGSHSLLAFATFIIGDTPFPEFSVVVRLDDIQLSYYDSKMKSLINTKSGNDCIKQEDASLMLEALNSRMRERALYSKTQLNLTHGVHVQQKLAGCELIDNDTPGPMRSWDVFNGVLNAEWEFSTQQNTLQSAGLWTNFKKQAHQILYANIYTSVCIKTLKNCLHMWKKFIRRKVKPRVRLLQKTLPDSEGVKVTCLATGFYPRHINLTLLRDDQPVSDHQITGGELLPNGDGTYQMRKSLEVRAEELENHQYTCTAEHLSLDNKLDINLDPEPGINTVSIVIPVVVGVLLLTLVGVIFMYWRKHRSPSDYVLAQKGDQHRHEMDQSGKY